MLSFYQQLDIPLAQCIEMLGHERFYPRFFTLMKNVAQIEQYCAFEFNKQGTPLSCRLAHNPNQPEKNLERADLYLAGGYLLDPLLQSLVDELKQHDTKEKPIYGHLKSKALPPSYRQRFYNNAQLGEKFALINNDDESGHAFYINFYRNSKQPFSEAELSRLTQSRTLISSLLIKHFKLEQQLKGMIQPLLAAGLSEREAQICEMISRGHTAKTMAKQLGVAQSSIVTFRKRAYKKLAIERKSQLLAWLALQHHIK